MRCYGSFWRSILRWIIFSLGHSCVGSQSQIMCICLSYQRVTCSWKVRSVVSMHVKLPILGFLSNTCTHFSNIFFYPNTCHFDIVRISPRARNLSRKRPLCAPMILSRRIDCLICWFADICDQRALGHLPLYCSYKTYIWAYNLRLPHKLEKCRQ